MGLNIRENPKNTKAQIDLFHPLSSPSLTWKSLFRLKSTFYQRKIRNKDKTYILPYVQCLAKT